MAQADANLVHGIETIRKGYCVPNKLLEERKSTKMPGGRLPCPEGLASFIGYADLNFSLSLDIVAEHHVGYANDNRCCLNPKQVVKISKCGEGWGHSEFLSRNFTCSQRFLHDASSEPRNFMVGNFIFKPLLIGVLAAEKKHVLCRFQPWLCTTSLWYWYLCICW
ncbi:hypothetical protein HPP92_006943 [Vanilla planifolia]|uniref:Uncharacterized protein n=1 Tax=Vanilla planifolia TaxID=51239 RepID=A0A835RLV3_VANPL|nr:hypothetical protein HPP92_007178 [Vanilla planifolia]KAG0490080.1 hypothetical protein HPP92_006943 [Vanilla planifolia]